MAIFQVKKYKTLKNEFGKQEQIQKTKEEWNKETRNGTMTWYFSTRYKINDKTKQYKSRLFALKREAEEQERSFLSNPIDYIQKHSKGSKNILTHTFNGIEKKHKWEEILNILLYSLEKNKESTLYSYRNIFFVHIKPFMDMECEYIEDFNLSYLDAWKEEMKKKRKSDGKEYSITYLQKAFTVISVLLDISKSKGWILHNMTKDTYNFTKVKDKVVKEESVRFQTISEFNLFFSVIDDLTDQAFFNFTFWHGPRFGEESAFVWTDLSIDWTITISSTFSSKTLNGGHKFTNTKNGKNRTIPVNIQSRDLLIKLYKFQSSLPGFDPSTWFIFGGLKYYSYTTMTRRLEKYYNLMDSKYNITSNHLTHHEFGRHSIASLMKAAGCSIEQIAYFLGDTEEVIRRTYFHVYKDQMNDSILEIMSPDNLKTLNLERRNVT